MELRIMKWFRVRREARRINREYRRIIRVTWARLSDPVYRAQLPDRVNACVEKIRAAKAAQAAEPETETK